MLKKAYRTILAQFWLHNVLKTEIIEESIEILMYGWVPEAKLWILRW